MFFSCLGLNKKRKKQQAECDNAILFLKKVLEEENINKKASAKHYLRMHNISINSIAESAQTNHLLASEILTNSKYLILFSDYQIQQILENKDYASLASQLIDVANNLEIIKTYSLTIISEIGKSHPQFFLKFIRHFNEETAKKANWYAKLLSKAQNPDSLENNYYPLHNFCCLLETNKTIFNEVKNKHSYLLKLLITDQYYGKKFLERLNQKYPEITLANVESVKETTPLLSY